MLAKLTKFAVVAVGLALATTSALLPAAPAVAEDENFQGAGFLNPFPPGDVYPLQTLGDTFAEGLSDALVEALGNEPRLQLAKKHHHLDSLMRNDFEANVKVLEEALGKDPVQIAVVMLGASDRITWRPPGAKRVAVGSDEWKAEYGRRVDRVMRVYKGRAVSVYWVGLPNMRGSDANDDAQMMNDIIRERAVVNGVRYIDSFQALADDQGGYSDFGPDLTGKVRRLREGDGVNFTEAGNRKLAHFVEKELRRDLAQAKQDRNIPLAGADSEQAKINAAIKAADAAKAAEAEAAAGRNGTAPTAGTAASGTAYAPAPSPDATASAADLKSDPVRISIKSLHDGREELVIVDIVRPALPASVVAAVTRKESADKPSQMGESLLDQIAGGITVVSSITPANEAGSARRKLSPTQSPYFRVLVKGERVTPKPGRADDMSWPRPAPSAFIAEAPKAAKPIQPAKPPAKADDEDEDKSKPAKRSRRNRS